MQNSTRRTLRRTTLATTVAVLAAFAGHSLAPVVSSAQTVPGTVQRMTSTVGTSEAAVVTGLVPTSRDGDAASTVTAPATSPAPAVPVPAAQGTATPTTVASVAETASQAAEAILGPQPDNLAMWIFTGMAMIGGVGAIGLGICYFAGCT